MIRKLACVAAALLLTGCSLVPTEERAFVLCVAVSVTSGRVAVTVQIPDYKGQDEYHVLTGSGASFQEAVSDVSGQSPAPLHFGQVRLVVLTRAAAEGAAFGDLVQQVSHLPLMRMKAQLFVTEDDPQALLKALTPRTGTRLSKYLDTLLNARREQGLLMGTTLSDVLRMGERQSPVLGVVALQHNPAASSGEDPADTSPANEAIFGGSGMVGVDGRLNGLLTAEETRTLSLLMGTERELRFQWDACAVLLHVRLREIKLTNTTLNVRIVARMQAEQGTPAQAKALLEKEAAELLTKLYAARCDALGLARQEVLGGGDLTDWANRLVQLTIKVTVEWMQSA